MRILLNLLLLVSVSVLGKAQNYEYKIDNRIRTFGTDFPNDSILWLMRNYYDIAFVPNNEVTFPYFNQFMKTIDEMGYIDSVLATTKIPYEASSARVFIGKDIPYEIAKGVISVLKDEEEVEVVCQVSVPNSLYNTYEYYSQSRTVIVGSRDCPYKPENKYIRKKETIDALMRADSKEHFLQLA